MTQEKRPGVGNERTQSRAEKFSFVASLLILMGVVSAVGYIWLTPSEEPAVFQVERGTVRSAGAKYYLDFTVKNNGDETGRNVEVEATLKTGEKEETASTVFDYISGHSEEQGVFIFSADPGEAVLSVKSYQKPG